MQSSSSLKLRSNAALLHFFTYVLGHNERKPCLTGLTMRLANRVSSGRLALGRVWFALCLQAAGEAPLQIQIRVLNAKNGERLANQKVSVLIKGTKNATGYTTDAEGDVNVDLPPEAEVFVENEWWITCRKMESGVDPCVSVGRVFSRGCHGA
jgi:hypothetical protein